MTDHVASALFACTEESSGFIQPLHDNPFSVAVRAAPFGEFRQDPTGTLDGAGHGVVSGGKKVIGAAVEPAMHHGSRMGVLLLPSRKDLVRTFPLQGKPVAGVL